MKSLRGKKQLQSLEHEEVYQKIKQNSVHMDEIQRNIEKQLQTFISINQSTAAISESMKKYSVESAGFNSRMPLSDCLQRSSEWQNTIGDVFKHLGNLLYDRTTQPLKETIRIQTDIVKDSKKRLKGFDSKTVSMTNVQSSPGSPLTMSNTMGIQKIEKRDQIEYEKLSKDTLQLYKDSELALENSAIHSVLSSFESYYDFFQKGAFQMNKIKTEIDNYKKIVLETNKAAAKLRNYVPRKTFGVRLEEVFAREGNKTVPVFLDDLFKHLEKTAPVTEGIFRISAGKSSVENLQKKIEDGVTPLDLSSLIDNHVASSVLKLFLRSLPESVINYNSYKNYLHLSSSKEPVDVVITELKRLISSLKVCNQVVLKHVLFICSLVNQNKEVSKMDLNNLAVVLGPTLMESIPGLKAEDLQRPDTFTEFYGLFMLLVENCHDIFPQVIQADFVRTRSQTEPAIFNSNKVLSSPISSSPVTTPTIANNSKNNLSSSDFVIINETNNNSSSNLSSAVNSSSSSPVLSSSNLASTVTPPSTSSVSTNSSASVGSPNVSIQKKIKKEDSTDYLKPIDVQIDFIHITSNLAKVKQHLDDITSIPEGIKLIKFFKKIGDDYVSPIQTLISYQKKPNPSEPPTDDKILRIQKTLSFTHDVIIESLIQANNLFESISNLDEKQTETLSSITKIFQNFNQHLQTEVPLLLNANNPSEINTSTASLGSV